MADTFPKMLAYIRAGREAIQVTVELVAIYAHTVPPTSSLNTAQTMFLLPHDFLFVTLSQGKTYLVLCKRFHALGMQYILLGVMVVHLKHTLSLALNPIFKMNMFNFCIFSYKNDSLRLPQ